jgi:hypothetical protein
MVEEEGVTPRESTLPEVLPHYTKTKKYEIYSRLG